MTMEEINKQKIKSGYYVQQRPERVSLFPSLLSIPAQEIAPKKIFKSLNKNPKQQ